MVNVGSADRPVRILLGAVLIAAPFVPFLAGTFAGLGARRLVVSLIGVVLVATAAMRSCPLYTLFGVRTCPAGGW